jgi:hypothetical protein
MATDSQSEEEEFEEEDEDFESVVSAGQPGPGPAPRPATAAPSSGQPVASKPGAPGAKPATGAGGAVSAAAPTKVRVGLHGVPMFVTLGKCARGLGASLGQCDYFLWGPLHSLAPGNYALHSPGRSPGRSPSRPQL